MALTKSTAVDLIEVVGNNVQVREATVIAEDDVEVAKTYHRRVVEDSVSARIDAARVELKAAVDEYLAMTPE